MADSTNPVKGPLTASALGRCYLTNKRLIFVAASATATVTGTGSIGEFKTLSVPIGNYQDGRLVQPWLAANYYEAIIRPVRDGGLSAPQLSKLSFKEGQSWNFVETLEEIRRRFEEESGRTNGGDTEVLPLYTPSEPPVPTIDPQGSYFLRPIPATRPSDDVLEAASIARLAEASEHSNTSEFETSDRPPAYES